MPPLPHHRAYWSRTRRFDRVKLGQEHRGGEDRGRRNTDCAAPVGPPDVLTCARTRSVSRRQPPRGTSARHGAAVGMVHQHLDIWTTPRSRDQAISPSDPRGAAFPWSILPDYHVTTMSAPIGALPLALARLGV